MHKGNHSHLFFFIIQIIFILFCTASNDARTFHAEGSDLFMGVGPKEMALGGAASAGTNTIYSVYWNPAGLAELKTNSWVISRQFQSDLDSNLNAFNFLGISFLSPWLNIGGLKSTIAFSFIPRIYAKSSGAFSEDDIESVFLRFLLPSFPSNFDGDLSSKTKDYRLTWAVTPKVDPTWSFGFTVSRIECGSTFCGVEAEDDEVTMYSANAAAVAVNMGGKYFCTDDVTFGFNIKDLDTTLDTELKKVSKDSLEEDISFHKISFPRDVTIGVQWRYSQSLYYSLDIQSIYGDYGGYVMDIGLIRAGLEYRAQEFPLIYRFGMIVPRKIEIEGLGRDPFPGFAVPTLGLGWMSKYMDVDVVFYVHPLMSLSRKTLYPSLDLDFKYNF
ncbi:hypothetical protein DID78_02855 [Candidatus Marinamargulisbacteria bacterium SCGC AG-343-D04]|nr:hypothetical protein DID78_02855 [Candidatus Marinamargulisbacteria bacterium SCGC AG-343-D04]